MPIGNIDSLMKKLSSVEDVAIEGAKKGMGKTLLRMQKDAKLNAPTADNTLINSIHIDIREVEKGIEGKVYTVNDHAIYVEFGTGPVGEQSDKVIPPGVALQYKDKGWLVPVQYFPNYERYGMIAIEIKGELFVPTRGQKAQQFMTPAAKNSKGKFKNDMSLGIRKELKELSK